MSTNEDKSCEGLASPSVLKVVRSKRLSKQVAAPRERVPMLYSRSSNTLWLGIPGMFHANLRDEFEADLTGDETLASGAVESDEDEGVWIHWDKASDEKDVSLTSVRLNILEEVFGIKPLMS